MLQSSSNTHHQTNLFGTDFLLQLDIEDPLFKLADAFPWQKLEQKFASFYTHNNGRPALPTLDGRSFVIETIGKFKR